MNPGLAKGSTVKDEARGRARRKRADKCIMCCNLRRNNVGGLRFARSIIEFLVLKKHKRLHHRSSDNDGGREGR